MCMRVKYLVSAMILLLTLLPTTTTRAEAEHRPSLESNAYDLVNAVNSVRAAYGLPVYNISSILIFTAQNQSDFMAATGTVTHSGPDGSTFTQRLLAAGYPLAGDLSLGGFRSENIIAGSTSMTAQDAVDAWMGDAPHQNTMLSQNLTEIGAGVTVANGKVYYVIDCARPTTDSVPPASTPVNGTESTVPVGEAGFVIPVSVSTPNVSGEVIHEVQSGQSLWGIAIAYGVKIDDIKRLNNLVGNDIYPGEKLLIKYEATPSAAPPIEMSTVEVTATMFLPTTVATMSAVATPATAVLAMDGGNVMSVALTIVAIAIFGAMIFTRFGKSTKDES